MQEQLPTRSEKAVQMGQEAMKVLFKEPIKEAVKETLAEEELVVKRTAITESDDSESHFRTEHDITGDESEGSGSRLFDSKVVIPAVILLGIAIAIRQLGEGSLNPEKIDELVTNETEPSMEEDMSKSAPPNPDPHDDETEEVNI